MSDQPRVEFEQTATKTEVTTHYRVDGAPAIRAHSHGESPLIAPRVVRFTFRDGEMEDLFVNGVVVKKNGDLSSKWQAISYLYTWNQTSWPSWLKDLYAIAMIEEYRQARRAEIRDAIHVLSAVKAAVEERKDSCDA